MKNVKNGNNEMEMIEYGGEMDENNVNDYLNCCPIYIGDYAFDGNQFRFVRSGIGNVLNEFSGICDWIGEWDEEGRKGEVLSNSLKYELIIDYYLIHLIVLLQ